MTFKEFKERLQEHFNNMVKDYNFLFMTSVDKDTMWETYLDSFPSGTNKIFRERREFDCGLCKQFIKNIGNVVVINEDNTVTSIWDFMIDNETYQPVLNEMSKLIKSAPICDVFITKQKGFGTERNREMLSDDSIHTWEHFRVELPKRFLTSSRQSEASIMGEYRQNKDVFKRSLEEISMDAVETVLDLISQKSLYKGEEWKSVLNTFHYYQAEYGKLNTERGKDNFCWAKSTDLGPVLSKIRNHSIGVLLTDISNGVELEDAVKRYESVVAPSNYKRPKAIFTKKMVEEAEQKVDELGVRNSLGRRHAVIDDININDVLFANRDAARQMKGSVFDELQEEVAVNPKKYSKVEEVPIEQFINEVLPNASDIQLLFENRHTPNLVSLIAPQDPASPSLFKWNNGFSWAYNGNVTDSMRQRVKDAGGNVEGVFRFSLQWNDNGENDNDFDAHCIEPNGNEIFFSNKRVRHPSSGMLDVDFTIPNTQCPDRPAVENIIYTDLNKMPEGNYVLFVHNYSHNGGRTGFSAEIEFDGQIYQFEYPYELKNDENVTVAKVRFDRKEGFKFIETPLDSVVSSKIKWNLSTNQFYPVSAMMFSPNYWKGEEEGIGHKHYFFMIEKCINEDQPNGFFNEFLKEEFMKHKRVFEALGSKMRVPYSENQLSGIGFSSTQRNSIICHVKGKFERPIKLTF